VITARGGSITDRYFYNNGEENSGTSRWFSVGDSPGGSPWANYDAAFATGTGTYLFCDFDLGLNFSNYQTTADFKYNYSGAPGKWSFAIGNNGSWRGSFSGTELWNLEEDSPFANPPFPPDDVEVFIIVRSAGITVAPGPQLINDATGGALPNPRRQILEAGFYLVDDGGGNLKVRRFYFGQAHNIE